MYAAKHVAKRALVIAVTYQNPERLCVLGT